MGANEPGGSRGGLRLEQLVALNDEVEALVRAGIPLERGLRASGAEQRGRLGAAIRDLAGRLEAGEPLPEAVARSGHGLPALYRAVVEAGLRAGSLPEALQGMARLGRAALEARRTLALACLYPLLVVVLAYGLTLLFLVAIVPRLATTMASFGPGAAPLLPLFERAGETAGVWGPVAPLALLVALLAWDRSGGARGLDGRGRFGSAATRLPWVGAVVSQYRSAQYVDLLGLLVAHDVPLDQALRLAGDASGDSALRRDSAGLADRVAAGDGASRAGEAPDTGAIPPLASWLIRSGLRQGRLADGLQRLAETYRRRAERRAEVLRVGLPGFLIVVIGAVAVLLYAVLLVLPLRALWQGLALPVA